MNKVTIKRRLHLCYPPLNEDDVDVIYKKMFCIPDKITEVGKSKNHLWVKAVKEFFKSRGVNNKNMKKIKMYDVESSNVKQIGYDENILFVLFKNNGLYKYADVPQNIFEDLLNAESVGKTLNKAVKKIYECERIWDDDPIYKIIVSD